MGANENNQKLSVIVKRMESNRKLWEPAQVVECERCGWERSIVNEGCFGCDYTERMVRRVKA